MRILQRYKFRLAKNKEIRREVHAPLPWFVMLLSISLLVVYWMQTLNQNIYEQLALDPLLVKHHFQYYRIFTSTFLHGGWDHVLENVILLLSVGWRLESVIGHARIAIVYMIASIFGSILSMIANPNLTYLGASIGISSLFGIVLLFRVCFRNNPIVPAFITSWQVINALFWLFIIFLIIYNLGIQASGELMINSVGHIGGLVGGIGAMLVLSGPVKIGAFNKYVRIGMGVILMLGFFYMALTILIGM